MNCHIQPIILKFYLYLNIYNLQTGKSNLENKDSKTGVLNLQGCNLFFNL